MNLDFKKKEKKYLGHCQAPITHSAQEIYDSFYDCYDPTDQSYIDYW